MAERLANGDPRLSLTERYGNHAGYVAAVTAAANNAFAQDYLLQSDRDALIAAAAASNVLQWAITKGAGGPWCDRFHRPLRAGNAAVNFAATVPGDNLLPYW